MATLSISAVNYDNLPQIRSLTAYAMFNDGRPLPLSGNIFWSFGPTITARYINGSSYTSTTSVVMSALSANLMVFTFQPSSYNFLTTGYSLLNYQISAVLPLSALSATYTQVADTFPSINIPSLRVNYESADRGTQFFRLTSATPFNASLSSNVTSYQLPLSSDYNLRYYVNGLSSLSSTTFLCSAVSIFGITASVSANTPSTSLSAWYSSHTVYNSITARFLSAFPAQPDFIAFPSSYFASPTSRVYLTLSNYTSSQGVSAYGEGHTEIFTVSAITQNVSCGWYFGETYTPTQYNSVSSADTLSWTLSVQSYPNNTYTVPIYQKINSGVNSISAIPFFYYDDVTGSKTTYPHVRTTVLSTDPTTELPSNTKYRQSIKMVPYAFDTSSVFGLYPGSNDAEVSLPTSSKQYFVADSNSSYSSLIGSVPHPFNVSRGSSQTWTVCSSNVWSNTIAAYKLSYSFPLEYTDTGTTIFTIPRYNSSTPVIVDFQDTLTGFISAAPYDWIPRSYPFHSKGSLNIVSNFTPKIFFSNKYVLSGTEVTFENDSIGLETLTKLVLDFDDGNVFTLTTPSAIATTVFKVTYTLPGWKNIVITSTRNGSTKDITSTFSKQLKCVTQYDVVDVASFRTENSPLNLPYTDVSIAPNEIVIDDNINANIKKIYDTILYLYDRADVYTSDGTELRGWLGNDSVASQAACALHTWSDWDARDHSTDLITWEDIDTILPSPMLSCGRWEQDMSTSTFSCLQKYCFDWRWDAMQGAISPVRVTWNATRSSDAYPKKWRFEECVTNGDSVIDVDCGFDALYWKINTPNLDTLYSTIPYTSYVASCDFTGLESVNNIIFASTSNKVFALSSDYTASAIRGALSFFDGVYRFQDIKNIAINSRQEVYVLDAVLNQVGVYTFNSSSALPWSLKLNWGGYGGPKSNNAYNNPTDIHVDAADYVYVTDSGNKCVKMYSDTGTWIKTFLFDGVPISAAVDRYAQVHVLFSDKIQTIKRDGTFLFEYTLNGLNPRKIDTNYNREILYVTYASSVEKYFRTGVFAGYLFSSLTNVNNIGAIAQDEFRNTLVGNNNLIVKYNDRMILKRNSGTLPDLFWKLEDLYIHREEYVQNWVYNKSFERLWDCVELLRNTLFFDDNTVCKKSVNYVYGKRDITVNQNELVSSVVINRCLKNIWVNLMTMIPYFDPNCLK